MENGTDEVLRRHLIAETGASTIDERKRVIAAILKASQDYPDYFVADPGTSVDNCKSEMFVLAVKINYFESYVSSTFIDRLKRDLHDRSRRLATLEHRH